MKRIVLLAVMLVGMASSYANPQVDQAFKEFYNNPKIDSNHCGLNTQYFLQYLNEKNIKFKQGFVVSLHVDQYNLYHFDPRWGRTETYQNGIEYQRVNYGFHVFAVIEGKAYDFSQAGMKTQPLNDYLELAYMPKHATESTFFNGVMTRESMLKEAKSIELKMYKADDYRQDLGPIAYQGMFYEMFGGSQRLSKPIFDIKWDSMSERSPGVVEYINPVMTVDEGTFKLRAYSEKICRGLGHIGSINAETEFELELGIKVIDISGHINTQTEGLDLDRDLSRYWDFYELDLDVYRNHFSYATKVVCADYDSVKASF